MQVHGTNIGRPIEFPVRMWARVVGKSLVADAEKSCDASFDSALVDDQIQVTDHPGAETVLRKDHQKCRSLDEEGFDSRFVQNAEGFDCLLLQPPVSLLIQVMKKAQVIFDLGWNETK